MVVFHNVFPPDPKCKLMSRRPVLSVLLFPVVLDK